MLATSKDETNVQAQIIAHVDLMFVQCMGVQIFAYFPSDHSESKYSKVMDI